MAPAGAAILGRGEHLRQDALPDAAADADHALSADGAPHDRRGRCCWFAIKVGDDHARPWRCASGWSGGDDGLYPPLFRSLVLLLSLRPILGDLHHGNNNLLILFLIVAMLTAWRQGYDVGAGLLLALATTYKVTPALFFVYFAYKRSWRTVMWGVLGMGIFLLIVPSLIIGPTLQRRNAWACGGTGW